MAEWCVGGREFEPRPGQYSRMSFSFDQVTGMVFPYLKMPFLQNSELILFRTLSSWGSGNYRPSAPLLYEVASHVKQLPFRPLLLLLLLTQLSHTVKGLPKSRYDARIAGPSIAMHHYEPKKSSCCHRRLYVGQHWTQVFTESKTESERLLARKH